MGVLGSEAFMQGWSLRHTLLGARPWKPKLRTPENKTKYITNLLQ